MLKVPRTQRGDAAARERVAKRKRAVTDSVTGYEELQIRRATLEEVHNQLDPAHSVWDELWNLWLLTGRTNLRWLGMPVFLIRLVSLRRRIANGAGSLTGS